MYAKVIVDIAHANVDRLFTYEIPDDLNVSAGQRVLVPFGAGNRQTEGFVLELSDTAEQGVRIKRVIRTLEPYSVLLFEQIELAKWIAASYHCLLVDALRLMIPAQLRGGRVKEKRIRTLCIPEGLDAEGALAAMLKKDGTPKAPLQYEVLKLLSESNTHMSARDICAFIPNAAGAIRALINKGLIAEQGAEVYRDPGGGRHTEATAPLVLNAEQRAALDGIEAALCVREGALLLHGVTGSGKTEVYMQAIAKALEAGGGAIVLVPEISLTPQTMQRFSGRFGDNVALLHSRLSAGERYDEWRRIRLGKAKVVLGARSAVFAPLENIRLIVIDEEHEPSYNSEITPRYSAVEVAAKRCSLNGAALVLGSATPSLQSYRRALAGRYTLLPLNSRVMDVAMPKVEIADMRAEFAAGNTGIFSAALQTRLEECLTAGEQAILFINRRGYSTFVSCRGCGYVIKCDNCDVSMTYHKPEERLKCHYCGKSIRVPKVCPSCGKPYLKYFGIGTQQVEEQLYERFPGVAALRMDMDTTRAKNSHQAILDRFASGGAQVLIGTQMVAKGLDIPNVTLVGIVAADASLHIPDYRSCERTFQLLTQVAGRAGRDGREGHVVIQTYTPEHPAISLAAAQDYRAFYDYEIARRRAELFPPFSIFARVLFTGEEEARLQEECEAFTAGLELALRETIADAGGDARELLFACGMPAPVKRRQSLFRYQTLLKLARTKNAPAAIKRLYAYTDEHRTEHVCGVEINPNNMF